MEHKKPLYTYIIGTTAVILLIIIGTNLLFFQNNLNQLTNYRKDQLEQRADTWANRMGTRCNNAHFYVRDIFNHTEQYYVQYAEQYPVWKFYESVTTLQKKLNVLTVFEEWAEDIGLIFKDKDLVISGSTGLERWAGTAMQQEFNQLDAVQRLYMQRVGDGVYLLDYQNSAPLNAKYTDLPVILYIRIDADAFVESLFEYMGDDLESFEITGPDGAEVLSYGKDLSQRRGLYRIDREIKGTHNSVSFYFTIPKYGDDFAVIGAIMICCTIIAVLSAVWYIQRVKRFVHTPVLKLVEAFRSFELGNAGVDLSGTETEEFAYLYEEIDKVMRRLKESVEKEYEQRLALQKSEMIQYQLQINPHFLYNGFYNIQRMISNGHEEKAAQLSRRMASYYRYITRNGIAFVTLEQEIHHMEDYISIQTIRFHDRVHVDTQYHVSAPQEVRLPRLIFQPIVENMYEHAFETIESDGKMHIEITADGSVMMAIFEDNGAGMPPQQLEQLNRQLDTDSGYTECTGILNVNKRLKLYYGANSGLHYEAGAQLGGARVVMRIELDRHPPERICADD